MFNVFVSLEDVLAPIGESKAPVVGMQVGDWDDSFMSTVNQIVDLGYAIKVIPTGSAVSAEALNPLTKVMEPDDGEPMSEPQVVFYYKGKGAEDILEGIPVLTVSEGKVQVSHEGRVKELAEYLGMLDHEGPDDENRY